MSAAPVPPQNLEAEESVLGAMMLSPGAIAAVTEILTEPDFYRASHGLIFAAAVGLDARGVGVDAITVVAELEKLGTLDTAGGKARIHELAALVPATANVAHYAGIVRRTAILRGMIRVGSEISKLGWEQPGETDLLLEQAERHLTGLTREQASLDFELLETILREAFQQLNARYEEKLDVSGVPSGFRDLDKITSGFQPGNLVVVAARPSMGKSALGLGVAANLALDGRPVGLFTLEMSKSEVAQRLICAEAKVESQKIRSGRLSAEDWARVTAACGRLASARLHVDESGFLTLGEVRAKARRLVSREPNLALLVVDYLQLMASGTTTEGRVHQVGEISRGLKVLAGELGIPIVAVSQLSRAVESRHDRRPLLSDLRDSGAIEQDADVVIFVYRDDYYDEDSEARGVAELIVAKHRNGPTDTAKLAFLKRFARFADLAVEPDTLST